MVLPAEVRLYAKSSSPSIVEVDQKKRLLRADRYRFLAVARDLLMAEGRKKQLKNPHDEHRTAKCMHIRREGYVRVSLGLPCLHCQGAGEAQD